MPTTICATPTTIRHLQNQQAQHLQSQNHLFMTLKDVIQQFCNNNTELIKFGVMIIVNEKIRQTLELT